MDLLEGLFARLSGWSLRNERDRRASFSVRFEECMPSLAALAQAGSLDSPIPLDLRPCDGFGSVAGDSIWLPSNFSPFDDRDLNRRLLLHKAIVGGVIHGLQWSAQAPGDSAIQQALEIFGYRSRVQEAAREIFPSYAGWSEVLLRDHARALRTERLEGADEAWLAIEETLASERFSKPLNAEDLRDLAKRLPSRWVREIDRLPLRALAPWCLPGISRQVGGGEGASNERSSGAVHEGTERDGKVPDQIQVVDLEKEKDRENPVTHSFEKLETADEYSGGYRTPSGQDDLDEHLEAIDELNLKVVTRGGESAKSIYRADTSDGLRNRESASADPKSASFRLYPEWDCFRRSMRPEHCRLYLDHPEPRADSGGMDWRDSVLANNQRSLEKWKHRLAMLVNERRWRDRQWEGPDLSIDAFVRYFSDIKNRGSGDPRVYVNKIPSMRDFSCVVLLDQSLSTDSWVANRRVLDVELEALAFISELLGPLREPVAVAGTWSQTRNHCSFRLYKGFDDGWSRFIDHAPDIRPQGYTRLGPAIRHATEMLSERRQMSRILILLTDGKPTDYDRYEGRYGTEDIRHACQEATQRGVQVRALTVEKQFIHAFSSLFGLRESQVIQDPELLPEQLFKIYLDCLRR